MSFPALIEELDIAVANGTAERRAEILFRITDTFMAGSAAYSTNQIGVFDDVFVRIAAVIESSARAVLSNRLANVPHAPSMISQLLASDDEIEVAGPMLEHSPHIDNETLVEFARTKSQRHLLAISRRSALDETVTDVLVERGDKPVVLSTASNPKARFSDNGYKTLVKRSDGDDQLATSIALRPDIPRDHLLRLVVRASHAVQVKLAAVNPSMATAIQAAVAEAATKVLDKTGASVRNYGAAWAHLEPLHAAGRLAEGEVADFAATGKFEETTVALALLCGLPIEAVEKAMGQERPEPIMVVVKAIGMTWPTAKAILRMCAGPRGISPGELDQCLDTFSRLKRMTARQVLEFQNKHARRTRFGRSAA